MGRKRTGSLWMEPKTGRPYARVTWVDAKRRRREIKRRIADATDAALTCRAILRELESGKRLQPNRHTRYSRKNILVYCVQILDGGLCPIKIGTTNNINKRVKMFLTHTPYEVKVLAVWPGDVGVERDVHAMFATSRITREWFRPSPELLDYIATKAEAKAA